MPTSVSLWSIEEYTSRVRSGQMIVDASYQRGSVWTVDQRLALMKSWLTGAPGGHRRPQHLHRPGLELH